LQADGIKYHLPNGDIQWISEAQYLRQLGDYLINANEVKARLEALEDVYHQH